MLFKMGSTTEEEIQVKEPLTYALYIWLQAIDSYTYATYPGDEECEYRSKQGDKAGRLRNFDFDEHRDEMKEQ